MIEIAEYIEREAVLNICQKEYEDRLRMFDYCGDTVAWNIGGAIKGIQAADVAPVSHGCEYCLDDDCPPLDWKYGLDHILPDYKFCPMCGRLMDGGRENEAD